MTRGGAVVSTGTQYSPFPIFDFRGGLNTKEAVTMIGNNESPDLLNVTFDVAGSIVKRNGYKKYIATAPSTQPVDGLTWFKQSNGNTYVMASSGGYLWAWYNNVWSQVDSIGASPNFETYYDTFYAVDGNKFIGYDGNVAQVVAGAPNGKYLKLVKNRLFLTGDPQNPNRVYFSDLGTPSSWPTNNFIDVNTNDGDYITGMSLFLDQLIIFKENSVWALFVNGAPSSWTLRCINPEYGCVSHRSISHLGNELWFLGRHGVYALHMTKVENYMNVEVKSMKIEPDVLAFWQPEKAQAATHKNRYWLSLPAMGYTYVYDMHLHSWTKYKVSAQCLHEQDGNLYSGGSTGYVYQQDTGTNDDGVAINAYYKTKYFDLGHPEREKKLKRILVFAEKQVSNASVGIGVGVDFNPLTSNFKVDLIPGVKASNWNAMQWGKDPWGGVLGERAQKLALSKQARYIQVTLSNQGLDESFTVRGFTVLYRPKALR